MVCIKHGNLTHGYFLSLCVSLVALALLPSLFVLHLERNAISKLEPAGLLSSVTPRLRELYLTNNTITAIAKGALNSAFLGTLHLDSNQLKEVPTHALTEAPNLEELNLSHNSIRWVGPNTFQPVSQSLKRLYMDTMGMEKVQETITALLKCPLHHVYVFSFFVHPTTSPFLNTPSLHLFVFLKSVVVITRTNI